MPEANEERIHAVISGSVQGIGYRYFCQRLAQRMKLSGWVKNLPNSDVEVEVQGSAADIKTFLSELRSGHPWAHVYDIKVTTIAPLKYKTGFEIGF